jgi:hypothetical protein
MRARANQYTLFCSLHMLTLPSRTWRQVAAHNGLSSSINRKDGRSCQKELPYPLLQCTEVSPSPWPRSHHYLPPYPSSSNPDNPQGTHNEDFRIRCTICKSLPTVIVWVLTYSVGWNQDTVPPQKFARFPSQSKCCWMKKRDWKLKVSWPLVAGCLYSIS